MFTLGYILNTPPPTFLPDCVTVKTRKRCQVTTPETPPVLQRVLASSTSLRILASAVFVLFLYYAAGVVITILLSVLIAYFLDPAVEYLERLRIPRTIGALIMVVLLIAFLGAVGYGLYDRTSAFAADWPKYRGIIREAFGNIQGKIGSIEGGVSDLTSSTGASQAASGSPSIHEFLVSSLGSLYALVLEGTFVPFLVFFMLAEKREVWHGTLQLFPVSRRTQVKETLEDLRDVLRDYLVGMCVVTLVVVALSSIFFLILGLDFPVLLGLFSGILNMVPYIGAVLAWFPAFLLAVVKYKSVSHFAVIAVVLTSIHVVAQISSPHNLSVVRCSSTPSPSLFLCSSGAGSGVAWDSFSASRLPLPSASSAITSIP